jgi:hypothetical protein
MKKFVTSEMIASAREIDLLTYLRRYEPDELVKISDNVYCTRSHDSLKISNGAWMWWSTGIGGYTALDYLVKVKGVSFVDAVTLLCEQKGTVTLPESSPPKGVKKTQPLLLPPRSENNIIALSYLCSRGIDVRITLECAERGLIYESLPYHSVVFVGFDHNHNPRYAGFRATNGQRIMGECSGSDKHYSFRMVGASNPAVHLFESAIDLLSFATLLMYGGEDYRKQNLLSLAGIYAPSKDKSRANIPVVLQDYLGEHPLTKKIFVHFDNDSKGRQAAQVIVNKLSDKYDVVDFPPPAGKDFNDFLLIQRQKQYKMTHSQER